MASLGRFAATRVLTGVLGLLQVLLLARWMPVGEFAAYSVQLATVGVATVIGSLGIDRVLYRELPLAHLAHATADIRRLTRLGLWTRLSAATPIAGLVVAATWSGHFTMGPVAAILFVAAMTASQILADVASATANALLRFEIQARVASSVLFVRLLATAALYVVLPNLSADVVLVVMIIGNLLHAGLVQRFGVQRALRLASREAGAATSYQAPPVSALARTALTNYLSYLFGLPWQGAAATLVVSATTGPGDVAVFALLQNLIDRLRQYLPLQLLQNAFEPILIRRYAVTKDQAGVARQVELLRRANFCILIAVAALCAAFGDALIGSATNGKYPHAGLLAAMMTFALALRGVSGGLFISANVFAEMPALTRVYGAVTLLVLPALFWTAHRYGAAGVALTSIAPSVLLWVGLRAGGRACARGTWNIGKDALCLACGAIAAAAGQLASHSLAGRWAVAFGAATLVLIYVTGVIGLRVVGRDDLALLRHALKGHST